MIVTKINSTLVKRMLQIYRINYYIAFIKLDDHHNEIDSPKITWECLHALQNIIIDPSYFDKNGKQKMFGYQWRNFG